MESLYEVDYAQWAETVAQKLEEKRFSELGELDLANLVEEIKDLSKRERDRLLSSMRSILQHLLKWDYQTEKRSRSWQIIIERERKNIELYLEDSPSLKRHLCQESVDKMYCTARLDAIQETQLEMPKECPYSIGDVLIKLIEGNFQW
ncbi:DUF29 domain-containing protein [Synechocystis sp. PCC 7339]|uniref:DUF29 domain-containing protein n=1 Tax=Synechocystis sp. PCC 7339 TaxID=2782213 RepID=UPI001CBEE5A3|nr:DUF29 domain-containing protein [Synechocystis sp. PCC 7339]UAJ72576.1 DUF29 domain-containing protein [Synechocystis sp. PCC 7339]